MTAEKTVTDSNRFNSRKPLNALPFAEGSLQFWIFPGVSDFDP